jgi:copper(I)-binding protein
MPHFTQFLRATLFGAFGAALMAFPALAGDISVMDPYARASGAMAKSGAVFMEIMNAGNSDDRLVAAHTDAAKVVELHTHIEDDNGVMLMREIEGGIALPAGQSHALARGGDHVMLMGLTGTLEQGDMIKLTLTFEKSGDMTIDVPVDNERKGAGHMKMKMKSDE